MNLDFENPFLEKIKATGINAPNYLQRFGIHWPIIVMRHFMTMSENRLKDIVEKF